MPTTEKDADCAAFARAALFPKRMHRDVDHANYNFPALLQLDRLRQSLFSSTATSVLFPRHVAVVQQNGKVQWNGQPDIIEDSFEVIPDKLSVRCTSECNRLFGNKLQQRAFVSPDKKEIVLCSDRLLQKDYKDARYEGVAKELPPNSFKAIEEALAHALVQVQHEKEDDVAVTELQAAAAAECYFSSQKYNGKTLVKKGSGLMLGYSFLPASLKSRLYKKCLLNVAAQHVMYAGMTQSDAEKAVQAAMEKNM